MRAISELDQRVSRHIHQLELGRLDYGFVIPGLAFGEYGVPVLLLALLLSLGWRFALLVTVASVCTAATTTLLKHLTGRHRPEPLAERAVPLRALVHNPAFPSGDSAQAAMLAELWFLAGPADGLARWGVWLLVPLCMFSRVYFGAHWVGDTLAGALIGTAVGLLAWRLLSPALLG